MPLTVSGHMQNTALISLKITTTKNTKQHEKFKSHGTEFSCHFVIFVVKKIYLKLIRCLKSRVRIPVFARWVRKLLIGELTQIEIDFPHPH